MMSYSQAEYHVKRMLRVSEGHCNGWDMIAGGRSHLSNLIGYRQQQLCIISYFRDIMGLNQCL
jgi:hypothetical protein